MKMLTTDLSAKERHVLLLIEDRGRILTRIKERSSGDVESVQPAPRAHRDRATMPGVSLDDDEVLACLHSLRERGLVRSEATVFRASTTEYICEWTLSDPA